MRAFIAVAIISLAISPWALAQNAAPRYRGEGYLFFGEGVVSSGYAHWGILHAGGGGDVRVLKGLGVDGELGAMGLFGYGFGIFSLGPSYHFLRPTRKSKFDPFVGSGYTRAFGNGGVNLMNFGGGTNYWLFRRVGVRFDFRDYPNLGLRSGWGNVPELRVGLVIR
jgi:hypothetical protein